MRLEKCFRSYIISYNWWRHQWAHHDALWKWTSVLSPLSTFYLFSFLILIFSICSLVPVLHPAWHSLFLASNVHVVLFLPSTSRAAARGLCLFTQSWEQGLATKHACWVAVEWTARTFQEDDLIQALHQVNVLPMFPTRTCTLEMVADLLKVLEGSHRRQMH